MGNNTGQSDLFLDLFVDNIVTALVFLFFICVVLATGIATIYFTFDGKPMLASHAANITAGLSSILLVGITAAYAFSTHRMVRENRIERLRPHIITLINKGVNIMIETLDEDTNKFDDYKEEDDISSLCRLDRTDLEADILNDIRRNNSDVADSWVAYNESKEVYREKWEKAYDQLEKKIEEEFIEMIQSASYLDLLPDDFEEEILTTDMRNSELHKYVETNISFLVDYVLEVPSKPDFNRIRANKHLFNRETLLRIIFHKYNGYFIQIREGEKLQDTIKDMENQLELLKKDGHNNLEMAESLREELMKDYDIMEIELNSSR